MRLSPLLIAAVAIATHASRGDCANAQTVNNSQQTTEVSTQPATNAESEVVAVFPAKSPLIAAPEVILPTSTPTTPQVFSISQTATQTAKQQQVVLPTSTPTAAQALGTISISQTTKQQQVVLPTSTPRTAQAPGTTPTPTPGPGQAPGINPSPIEQPTLQITPQPTLQRTPQPTLQRTPQPNPAPDIPLPNTQQQPNQAPGIIPSQENLNTPGATPEANESRVLVSEVLVRGQAGQLAPELEKQVYTVIRTQPGRTTTRSQLQQDINAIFATGLFSNVQAVPEDTPLGVRVSFVVQANPQLTKVQVQANPGTGIASVLPATAVDEIFREQYGRILNLRDLQESIKRLTKLYQDRGYVLANVIGAPQVSENGVVTLQIAEGVVENIRVRFRNKEGQETDEKGNPIRGRTQEYIVKRELQIKSGQIFNRNTVQKDLQRVFGLGLFEDVNVSLDPGTDPSKVDVVVNVVERNSGSIAAGAGISSASGLFGTISYQQQNLGGRNQKLGAELQLGQRDLLFDLRFTDPWIAGDPYRTSYTANVFRRQSISLIFDGKNDNIETFNPNRPTDDGDRPRVVRTGGGVTFTRPLSRNPFENSEWTASAGLQYQRVAIKDADGNVRKFGRVNNDPNRQLDLSASGGGQDDLLLFQLGAQRDRRNNPLQPTSGSFLRFGVDQSVPVGLGNIFLTRLRGSYSQYLPVKFTNFTKGPQALAFNLQAGTVLGDLPPYEAFSLGGSNSVRGYEEGALGAGRSFVQATVEYRFPVFSVVSGALFFDLGTDLGSSTRSSDLLNKPGTGYGYGLGVRVQSPLGPIRIDYGINDDGDSRINFGIGERF